MIDIKSSITRIVVLEMTESDAMKLYRALNSETEKDKEDYQVQSDLARTIHNALYPNVASSNTIPRKISYQDRVSVSGNQIH